MKINVKTMLQATTQIVAGDGSDKCAGAETGKSGFIIIFISELKQFQKGLRLRIKHVLMYVLAIRIVSLP